MGSIWEGLIKYYDAIKGGMCPVAHTYIMANTGVLLNREGEFLCAKDVSDMHELITVPCTIESESRTSNTAPHLLSDNFSYVGNMAGFFHRFRTYKGQLEKYLSEVPEDEYARIVYTYILKGTLADDIKDIISAWKYDLKNMNVIFTVYGMENEGWDQKWTEYYPASLPKNGICAITGERDYIPGAYPAGIISDSGKEKLFLSGSGVGYIASQKIIHALQYLTYAEKNRRDVLIRQIKEEIKGMRFVKNEHGTEIIYEAAVSLMDAGLREEVHREIAPCTEQEFFDAYVKKHAEKYGEEWELAKANPCY